MILRNIIAIPGSRHLRRISLLTYQEWLELDRLLPRLWESRSIKISRETREAFGSNLYPLSNIVHL